PYPGINVSMLLSHRSGLPNYLHAMDDKKLWDKNKTVTNEDMLQFLIQHQPKISFKPNTRFNYCNTNYVLLAMIIEKVSGKSFPDFLRENLFLPMGMTHSFVFTRADSATATPSFNYGGNFWKNDFLEYTYGDKNVYSTPQDMLKWDEALYSGKFIRQSLLDSAFTPQSHEKPSVHNYGLGWRLLMIPNGKKVVYHFGKWHGFTPAFARLTDERATIIILGNKYNSAIYRTAGQMYKLFGDYDTRLGQSDPDENRSTAEPPPPPPVKKATRSKLKVKS
ncbi:MAG: class A beta-lactamase-related serine hydrolase, partial [Chryseobacterium sp.]